MNLTFLSNDFYNDYSHCSEIEMKPNRPYVMVLAAVNGIDFAIPRILIFDKTNLMS